ncbi:hypothetical protein J4422_02480 [Candidatus Pacearchaeota archaeon]|nr:hypothetical protein [Candidatus Pacearchaeota archaeon]
MSLIRLGVLAAGLAIWYPLNKQPSEYKNSTDRYALPQEIEVVNASYHIKSQENPIIIKPNGLEQKIQTKAVDFSEDFVIETDRYKLVKDKDWLPSRLVGHTFALPGRLIFWDWDYGWGQDEERTKAVLSMLEKDTTIKDITVRLNHNEAFYDLYRMFTEEKLRKRNNIFARVLLGIPMGLGNEIWAEFSRGSYYNPLTKTTVCYSNVESITAHEIGHHKDFSRFSSDWGYQLLRILPPFMLSQEWKASVHARDEILNKKDQWQFNRYLIPAFATYVLASIAVLYNLFKKKEEEQK